MNKLIKKVLQLIRGKQLEEQQRLQRAIETRPVDLNYWFPPPHNIPQWFRPETTLTETTKQRLKEVIDEPIKIKPLKRKS